MELKLTKNMIKNILLESIKIHDETQNLSNQGSELKKSPARGLKQLTNQLFASEI